MKEISITDFRNNIKHYSEMVKKDDLLITNDGKPVMRVSNPNKNKVETVQSLFGCVKSKREFDEVMKDKLQEL